MRAADQPRFRPPSAEEARERLRRGIGSPALFTIVYTTLASAVYFSLGVIADNALGLTPFVLLAAGLFFVLTSMTYVEGASLHQERGGSTVFARYAFNELWSFIAGWALLLDYVILIAVTTVASTDYLAAYWSPLGRGSLEVVVAVALIAYVAIVNVRGVTSLRYQRLVYLAIADLAVQSLVIVLGLALVFSPSALLDPIELGVTPRWEDVVFALTIATVAFTGLESSAGLAGEVAIGRRGLRRLIFARSAAVIVVYVGIALVALTALPVRDGRTELDERFVEAPVLGVVQAFDPAWLGDALGYVVAITAAFVLVSAANGAMLGLSRLGVSLATNRQIPSALGRLHTTRSTPFVLIGIAAILACALVVPRDIELLVSIYAFGALLAMTIAHVAVCVLRYREPDRDRPYRMPWSVRIGGGDLPLPAALGGLLAALAWVSVMVFHEGARYVGLVWMAVGLLLYVVYRTMEDKPLLRRVTVPATALRAEQPLSAEYGSILVPIFGTSLDDDIVQTAGRLASAEHREAGEEEGATIEVVWVFEVPMSLPIDARLPEAQQRQASEALARAKRVGEEYEGVMVATAKVRARRAGQAIVDEARRRGVEAIVLAAEEPSRIRGGALLGGRSVPLENFVGDVTKYVVNKAPCRVILTAPAAPDPVSGETAPPR